MSVRYKPYEYIQSRLHNFRLSSRSLSCS